MYSKPETDTTPVMPMSIICASGDGNHVTVNNNAQNDLIID